MSMMRSRALSRNLVNKTNQILVGIPESHPPSDSRFKEGGTPAEIESHHALVLVPDIYGPVELLLRMFELVNRKQPVPELSSAHQRPFPHPLPTETGRSSLQQVSC